ncbi:DUF3016 domain-containing protein [Ferrimonas futtsuensis]|uniref:DUF3016 domain-containing protein n=1 Tax=Ferrimonas futtsuensis TaxID=364764 RepID=UPI00048711BD|nr:DUF3016 domain-containing protein [Ferrimonas futtsuensis]
MRAFAWLMLLVMSPWAAAQSDAQEWPTQDGPVTVIWQSPDDYRDVRANAGRQDRFENHVFATLGKEFQKSLKPLLNEGEKLVITVMDLDLAGDVRPSFGAAAHDIRIVKSVYPPMIEFSWSLQDASGKQLDGDKVKIKDLNFERGSTRASHSSDSLRYETAMIENWAKRDLPQPLAARR